MCTSVLSHRINEYGIAVVTTHGAWESGDAWESAWKIAWESGNAGDRLGRASWQSRELGDSLSRCRHRLLQVNKAM